MLSFRRKIRHWGSTSFTASAIAGCWIGVSSFIEPELCFHHYSMATRTRTTLKDPSRVTVTVVLGMLFQAIGHDLPELGRRALNRLPYTRKP